MISTLFRYVSMILMVEIVLYDISMNYQDEGFDPVLVTPCKTVSFTAL